MGSNPDNNKCERPAEGKTGFYITKYEDKDGDATRDSDENGLSWEFEWMKDNDGVWHAYTTAQNDDGKGTIVDGFNDSQTVTIREKMKEGWKATTGTQVTVQMERGQTKHIMFGNQPLKPTVVQHGVPQQLPKTGSEHIGFIMISLGLLTTGYGLQARARVK